MVANHSSLLSAIPSLAQFQEHREGDALAERLAQDMEARWKKGERPRAEEYLCRHPELNDCPEAAVRLICEEICLSEEQGTPVTATEVLERFPRWRKQLEIVLDCQRLLRPQSTGPVFPESGEPFGDFFLVAELGRGAQGRVFLATQPALADRPVVLKLTPRSGQEHLALARLQHTHIVPLHLAHDDAERQLRILCMPYFGGVSLAQVLESLQDTPVHQRSGADLLQAITEVQLGALLAAPTDGPARRFCTRATYVQAVCWIGACLADALHYAHEHRLVHLDVKPSNVLMAADGQPMLLDFHLARQPLQPDGALPEWFGGTPGYMAPEQRAALTELTAGRPLTHSVDRRADIYSLGLLLFEALSGQAPPAEPQARSLERVNPEVGIGLTDVIDKCLQRRPEDRYGDAALLADDLRRHLADLPLRGVPNRSWAERWQKWRRRRPHALKLFAQSAIILALLAGAGTFLTFEYRRQLGQAERALAEGREQLGKRYFAEAIRTLERGFEQAHALPGQEPLASALEQELRSARQTELIQQLHEVANQVRFHADSDALPVARLQALEHACRTVWDARAQLEWSDGLSLSDDNRKQLRADLLDLALLGSGLQVRLAAPGSVAEARRAALATVVEAERMYGPSAAVYREQQYQAAALGLDHQARTAAAQASQQPPRSAWDHYALGRALQRQGKTAEAKTQFDRAVFLQPDGFWASFYQGTCAYRLGQHQQAVEAFRACLALAPEKAECYYNRGLAYQALNQLKEARLDYDQALRLDATLALAEFNRGIVHFREKNYRAALSDLEQALAKGAEPAPVCYQLALTHSSLKNWAAARRCVHQALKHRPAYKEAEVLLQQLQRER